MKNVFGFVGLVLVGLIAVILVRTLMFTPPPLQTEEQVAFDVDADLVAQHLSEAVRFETVSPPEPQRREYKPFDDFLAWAEATYPEFHELEKTVVETHTVLFKWQGTSPDLKPVLLAAHYDVVPVVPGTEESWTHPPLTA